MKQISQIAEDAIAKLHYVLESITMVAAGIALVALTAQASLWVRDEVYVSARMEIPEYVAKVRSGCKKADGCLSVNVTFSHLWAADKSRLLKLGTHMRIEMLALPQAYERSIDAVAAQMPESDRQFVRFTYPANALKSNK